MSTKKVLIEEDIVVKMPPKRKYKVKLKIRKISKAKPRIVSPNNSVNPEE